MAAETVDLIDKYVVLEKLGSGAKSTIWKVRDPGDDAIYTLKRVIRESRDDDRFLEQAKTEFEVCSVVEHETLRKSFDLRKIYRRWIRTAEVLLLLEYVEGVTLKARAPSEIEEVIDIFQRVAEGLDSLHQLGYIHADLKPKNILLTGGDSVKIIDFGQSCPIGHRKQRIQGTPQYIAPEQVKRGILDQRTDVFNIGASMYWVLTGKTYPTVMSDDASEISLASSRKVQRPDEVNSEVPTALSKLVMDCCSDDPAKRPENMAEFMARLEVSRHLLMRQKHPENFLAEDTVAHGEEAAPLDDSVGFDEFLDDIL